MRKQRSDINRRLSEKIRKGSPVQGICVSSGLEAKVAEKAGADFLVTYAGALFRREGVPASLCELCYEDCNSVTEELGRHILPRLEDIPLIGGIGCLDPYRDIDKFIDGLTAIGFSGVANLPSIGDWKGDFRTMPEQLHMGYEKEVELIQRCHNRGLFTFANCYTQEQAVWMAGAGADVICIDLGATQGGLLQSACMLHKKEASEKVKKIADEILALKGTSFILFHGGPFATAGDIELCLETAAVHGVFSGSAAVRIPIEQAVSAAIEKVGALQLRGRERNSI